MHQILNTLFVMTQGAYLRLDHENLKVEVEKKVQLDVPLHHLGGIVVFGNVLVSPFLIHRCGEDGRIVVFMDKNGRFKARLTGSTSGNVLLRRIQHKAVDDPNTVIYLSRQIVSGKIQNTRQVVLRAARESKNSDDMENLRTTANKLAQSLSTLGHAKDVEVIRGVEGFAAKTYFESFNSMIRANRHIFTLDKRIRRPPRDMINALLSFLYALVLNDCVSASEGVGLDPQVGYFHALRPGRPALALDLMEELRSIIADRLTLTLINRLQIGQKDFDNRQGGAVYLNEDGRKKVIVEYQKRKQEEIIHPILKQRIPYGLISHTQARLLARFLRGDTDAYIPFLIR
ncbi:type I-C CRISPR-associated endonuclease Cas1c [candidate division KSB1 bacterium]